MHLLTHFPSSFTLKTKVNRKMPSLVSGLRCLSLAPMTSPSQVAVYWLLVGIIHDFRSGTIMAIAFVLLVIPASARCLG